MQDRRVVKPVAESHAPQTPAYQRKVPAEELCAIGETEGTLSLQPRESLRLAEYPEGRSVYCRGAFPTPVWQTGCRNVRKNSRNATGSGKEKSNSGRCCRPAFRSRRESASAPLTSAVRSCGGLLCHRQHQAHQPATWEQSRNSIGGESEKMPPTTTNVDKHEHRCAEGFRIVVICRWRLVSYRRWFLSVKDSSLTSSNQHWQRMSGVTVNIRGTSTETPA